MGKLAQKKEKDHTSSTKPVLPYSDTLDMHGLVETSNGVEGTDNGGSPSLYGDLTTERR